MGLYRDHLVFPSAPPTRGELAAHLRARIDDDQGIEHYGVEGGLVELRCTLDPLTRPYALAFLGRRGGVLVDAKTRAPLPLALLAYIDRPWRDQPWWRRLRVRLTHLLGR